MAALDRGLADEEPERGARRVLGAMCDVDQELRHAPIVSHDVQDVRKRRLSS